MSAVALLVRSELRARWRGALLFGLVGAVGAAAVMVTLAGARRSENAFERFRESVRDGHVFVGVEENPDRLGEVASLPGVESFAPFGFVAIRPVDAPIEAEIEGGGFASLDGTWLYDVQRPRVLDGAMPEPSARGVMVVNEAFAELFDVRRGEHLAMRVATERSVLEEDERFDVVERLAIAAIVRTPLDLDANAGGPIVYLPPGFFDGVPEAFHVRGFAMVRLTGGDDAAARYVADAEAVLGDEPSFDAGAIGEGGRASARPLEVQATALRIVALVVALAMVALLAQAAAREVRAGADEAGHLRALGATRMQRVAALSAPLAMAVIPAIVAAGGSAVLTSPLLPRGLARAADPDVGTHADWAVLAGVSAASALVVVLLVLGVAARAVGTARRPQQVRAPGLGLRTVAGLRSLGGSPPLVTGVHRALPGQGDRRLVGIGYAALLVGTAGLVAALSFGDRFDAVVADTDAWGTPFDLYAQTFTPRDDAEALAAVDGVEGVTEVRYSEAVDLGSFDAPLYGVRAVEGPPAITVIEGRPIASETEVVLGDATAGKLEVGIGDEVAVPLSAEGELRLEVVGIGLLPVAGDGTYDTGVVASLPTFDRLAHDDPDLHFWVSVESGASVAAVGDALTDLGTSVAPVEPPSEQRNLEAVRAYPWLVGAILALLAVGGLGNALLTGGRRRRAELATLRALGFSRRQVRASVGWQAIAVAVGGLLVAVPVGFLAARPVWQRFADPLSLDTTIGASWGLGAAVAAAVLATAAAISVPIGVSAGRRPAGTDLRIE